MQIVEVLEEVEEGWWKGSVGGKTGVFPSNFVEILEEEEETGQPKQQEQPGRLPSVRLITEVATTPHRSEANWIHGQCSTGPHWCGSKRTQSEAQVSIHALHFLGTGQSSSVLALTPVQHCSPLSPA